MTRSSEFTAPSVRKRSQAFLRKPSYVFASVRKRSQAFASVRKRLYMFASVAVAVPMGKLEACHFSCPCAGIVALSESDAVLLRRRSVCEGSRLRCKSVVIRVSGVVVLRCFAWNARARAFPQMSLSLALSCNRLVFTTLDLQEIGRNHSGGAVPR